MITNKEIQPGVYNGKLTLTTLREAANISAEYKILEDNDGIADS